MNVTCHVLAGNNENTIADCLESVIRPGLFAEILVFLDTRSSDRTGRILKFYQDHYTHIKVLTYKWQSPPDFAKVRNDGIGAIRTAYGYWQDSDEILKKPGQIKAMLSSAVGQAFQMWVISPVGGGRFHNMFQPRLFPVVPGVEFQCPVFERLDWSLQRLGIRIEPTEADPIWHPGYTDDKTLKAKNKRNMGIMKKYLREHQKSDSQREHILTQYLRLGGKE